MSQEEKSQGFQGAQGSQGPDRDDVEVIPALRPDSVVPEHLNDLARRVVGAAIEVHRHLGPGYSESVYESALAVELELRGIPFERQVPFRVPYKGRPVGEGRLDLLIAGELIVELKAVDRLSDVHFGQALGYLRATGRTLALLVNFDVPVLLRGVKRVLAGSGQREVARGARAQGAQESEAGD